MSVCVCVYTGACRRAPCIVTALYCHSYIMERNKDIESSREGETEEKNPGADNEGAQGHRIDSTEEKRHPGTLEQFL